jgi:hypothetical protein
LHGRRQLLRAQCGAVTRPLGLDVLTDIQGVVLADPVVVFKTRRICQHALVQQISENLFEQCQPTLPHYL